MIADRPFLCNRRYDEVHQYFVPGRIFLVSDMIINAAGEFLGVLLALLLSKMSGPKNNKEEIRK